MSRDDGFSIADVDVGIAHDPKVLRLARRLRDPVQTAAHFGLYLALVTESWRRGDRASLEDACPAWWLSDLGPVIANLAAVGLVDPDGRISLRAWESWFTPAWERRDVRRKKAASGGRASHRNTESTWGSPGADPGSATGEPVTPSVTPTGPSEPPVDISARLTARADKEVDRV